MMLRTGFNEQMAELNQEMIAMGALCEEAIAIVSRVKSLSDAERRSRVLELSHELDKKERDVESRCLKLLLKQQPIARDLRQISAALKMITDMERIGDQAEDIAEISAYLGEYNGEEMQLIHHMAEESSKMVTDSVDAFVRSDVELAEAVLKHDDIVDEYFLKVKRSLVDMIVNDREKGERALDLLMIAKYFERIGDHATNIAEWVIYSVTGVHPQMEG